MVDGIELKGRCCIVALGVTTDGVKLPLGLWDGSTENKTVTAHLLADLVARGLDVEQGVLVVLDGSKALRAAVDEVFGPVPVRSAVSVMQGTQRPGSPPRARPPRCEGARLRLRMEQAITTRSRWRGLQTLAGELEHSHPGAASSLAEGLEETLTLTRLGIRGRLKKTLASTNPIESMIEIIRRTSRNVKRWQNGDMCLRWTAAGMLEAETQFWKVVGYTDLAKLALAVERDLAAQRTPFTPRPRRPRSPPSPCKHHTPAATTNFYGKRDNLRGSGHCTSGCVARTPTAGRRWGRCMLGRSQCLHRTAPIGSHKPHTAVVSSSRSWFVHRLSRRRQASGTRVIVRRSSSGSGPRTARALA